MKKADLRNRRDLVIVVDDFYKKVLRDPELAPFFTTHHQVDFEKHLPRMYDYWENMLFHTGNYQGQPIKTHAYLHEKAPLASAHFLRWIELFHESIDAHFIGEQAEELKLRSRNIAYILDTRVRNQPTDEQTYEDLLKPKAKASPKEKA